MMRSNAPIQAFLALAVLSFLPAPLLAKPAPLSPAHKTAITEVTPRKRAHKKGTAEATASRKHHASKANEDAPATVRNTRTSRHRVSSARHSIASTEATPTPEKESTLATDETTHRKATSADFLKAASGQAVSELAGANEATPEAPHADKALASKNLPAEKPIPVVNAVRKTTERPQLEPVEEAASNPVILPALYNKRGHLIVPRPLKGSHEILVRQNQVADREGLDRIQNDDDLDDMRTRKLLVAIPANEALQVDERLPSDRRYCRPWTAQFLATLSRAHYARFHTPLQINSAVRTVEFQQRLLRTNGNAAPAEGETASPHLTGQAIDLAKHGLSLTEIAWLRGYLLPLVQQGKVDVEEEFQQACFHISVYKKYLPSGDAPGRIIATTHGSSSAALATAIH